MSSHRLLLITTFALCANTVWADSSAHLYSTQLVPQLLRNINIEEPSEQELNFINACRAHDAGGTQYPLVGTENWQAIVSIDGITQLLRAYARNITLSGYIALGRQMAQMTDHAATLEKRIALTQHLEKNSETTRKLAKILTSATHAEQEFFKMFRQITEEEQAELDKNHAQLYFDPVWYRPNFDSFNENALALEVGPRWNQLMTAAAFTVPATCASFGHHILTIQDKIQALQKNHGPLKTSDANLQKSREDLLSEITTYRWANENFLAAKKALQEKNIKELSKLDQQILKSTSFDDLPIKAQEQFNVTVKQLAAAVTYDGVRNLPDFTVATGKTVYNHVTGSPFYEATKKALLDRNKKWSNSEWEKSYILSTAEIEEFAIIQNRIMYTSIAFYGAIYAYILYWRYGKTKTLLDLIHDKQKDLLMAGHLVKSMKMVHKLIESDATLQRYMSVEHAKLGELFNPSSKKTSADLKNLINALMSSSFQGKGSYFFSQQGKILATHHLLMRIKAELIPYLEAFGQVDAYLATATLYQEFKDHSRVHFCLPEFVDAPTPIMDIQEYWHPLIDAHKVVTNTLNMNFNNAANLIITGPNAGGKTTSLMSLIINIIFAQSWGIAPSSSLRMTPFAKIHSYLDITTNLQEGLSLFAAEVDRAKKLKISIISCKPGQKTFTIIDEIFSGTDPKVASEVGFTFASQLGDMAHSMTIITTHFPALTELEEKTKHYVNYKVADATINVDGSIVYPFKLVQGISTQNIAAQMLHNQGII